MKKHYLRLLLLLPLLSLSISSSAQTDLKSVLGSVLGGGSSSGSDLVSNLTSVFSSNKQATANKIVGTWSYSEPAIVFTSDNILAKAASKVASNKVESKIQEYLSAYGIKPGALVLTFNEDGTCTQTLNGRTAKGKWQVKDSKLILTLGGVKALSITTQIDGKDMQFVTDATKFLNLLKTMGAKSNNTKIKTVTSLMKSVSGMQAGVTLRKQ
jgi:hypothetical protein